LVLVKLYYLFFEPQSSGGQNFRPEPLVQLMTCEKKPPSYGGVELFWKQCPGGNASPRRVKTWRKNPAGGRILQYAPARSPQVGRIPTPPVWRRRRERENPEFNLKPDNP
jgi:hypothetical protein